MENSYSNLNYIYQKSKEITKKTWTSSWDVFLFIFLFTCGIIFTIGLVLFLLGGIGFINNVTNFNPETLENLGNKTFDLNLNGYWAIENWLGKDYSWNDFVEALNKSFVANEKTPTQLYILNSITMKQLYDIGMWMFISITIVLMVFILIVFIVNLLWKKGYFEKIGIKIFSKYDAFTKKIDNHNKKKDNAISQSSTTD